jgi:carbon monoxide dehydrogenase subunit G
VRLDHSFTVPVPVDEAWHVLLDVPQIAPCMPGAALTECDDDTFAGMVKVKLGPITLSYRGKGRFVERDEAAHRAVIAASGRDSRTAGTANATVTAVLVPDGDATRVAVTTDLTVTGRPAQFGRGMLADVGGKLIDQFAERLAAKLSESGAPAAAAEPAPSEAPEHSDRSPTDVPARDDAAVSADSPGLDVEPFDLLRVSAGSAAVRRYAAYALAAGATVIVAWLVIRALRRG